MVDFQAISIEAQEKTLPREEEAKEKEILYALYTSESMSMCTQHIHIHEVKSSIWNS